MMTVSLNQSDWNAKQIIQNSHKLINVNSKNHRIQTISNRIKGRILMGLIDKFTQKQHSIKDYFVKWQAKTQAQTIKSEVLLRILTQQRLSQFTFLYRLKAHCQFNFDEIMEQNNQVELQKQIIPKDGNNSIDSNNRQIKPQVSIQNFEKNKQNLIHREKIKKQIGKENLRKLNKPKQKDIKKQNSLAVALIDLRGHLRCISQQASIPMSSEKQFSQNDALQNLDRRLDRLNQRMKVSSLRACELILRKASQRLKIEIFRRLFKKQ